MTGRARRLWRYLRAPVSYPRGGLLLWVIALGTSHDLGAFLARHQDVASPVIEGCAGSLLLAMTARFGWLWLRQRRRHHG